MTNTEPNPTKPIFTMVTSITEPALATAIYRRFRPGDAANCRLCDRCTTKRDECVVVVPGVFNILEVEGLEVIKVTGGWQLKPQPSPDGTATEAEPAEILEEKPALDWFREVMGV